MDDEASSAAGDAASSAAGDAAGRAAGGSAGRRPSAARAAVIAGSVAALIVASLLGGALGSIAKAACRAGAWNVGVEQYQAHCYTDIYPLYFVEGLANGKVPYVGHHVEYPVVMGAVMQAAAWVVHPAADPGVRGQEFYDVTVALLCVCLVGGVLATAYCAGRSRRWTALLVAFAPALILAAFINWDLIAMGLSMAALAAWAARRNVLAGLLLGLAVATKFYPVICLVPLFALCLRAGRLREFWLTTCSAAGVWLVVNIPIAVAAPSGWATFYTFNAKRGADWGSIWYFFQTEHWPVVGGLSIPAMNLTSAALFIAACGGVGVLALAAPRRPRLPQLIFLLTAAFLLTNKVWSPQYVVWLVPLVVLARPRLGGYLLWQAAEVAYFYAIWGYLIFVIAGPHTPDAVPPGWYFAALLARFVAVVLLCALVIRDIIRPQHDVVRAGAGPAEDSPAENSTDDPAGGVLNGAADQLILTLPHATRGE
ncbi:MAG TPA: glycosyltransferase 87 family protein [Streptosporangiaceae bacterium]